MFIKKSLKSVLKYKNILQKNRKILSSIKTQTIKKNNIKFYHTTLRNFNPPKTQEKKTEPKIIFENVITKLANEVGESNLSFPKEIIFLAGAPGAGKGTMTKFILEKRGLTAEPITASSLLQTPELKKLKDAGKLINDSVVCEAVFRQLLLPKYKSGCILDGFPRTHVQAQCISKLYDKMHQLRKKFSVSKIHKSKFRRPTFHIIVLFCDQDISVERQISRGLQSIKKGKMLGEEGASARATDLDRSKALQRYEDFKNNIYESLSLLKQKFNYHFIDANGTIEECANNVQNELKYQSSMELGNGTYEKIHHLPVAEELVKNARYKLVRRIDDYQMFKPQLFEEVINLIKSEFLHILHRQALCGVAVVRSTNPTLEEKGALNILLDVLTERGFEAHLDFERGQSLVGFNEKTGKYLYETTKLYHFRLRFEKPVIRSTN